MKKSSLFAVALAVAAASAPWASPASAHTVKNSPEVKYAKAVPGHVCRTKHHKKHTHTKRYGVLKCKSTGGKWRWVRSGASAPAPKPAPPASTSAECVARESPAFVTTPSGDPLAYRANSGVFAGVVWPVQPWTDSDAVAEQLGTWDVSWFRKGPAEIKYVSLCEGNRGDLFKHTMLSTEIISVWVHPESDPWAEAGPYAKHRGGYSLVWREGDWIVS